MAQVELIMPKMGESIMEATILKWVKQVGDSVEVDETILEIATDKVDSEVPSPVSGVIAKILFPEDETVEIGKVIAVIATEGEEVSAAPTPSGPAPPATTCATARRPGPPARARACGAPGSTPASRPMATAPAPAPTACGRT